jgi:hypothetical protein
MKVNFAFVPVGGGKPAYFLDFDLPEVPRIGDAISIRRHRNQTRPEDIGTEDYVVKHVQWTLDLDEQANLQKDAQICVECEFVVIPGISSESHGSRSGLHNSNPA